MILLVTHGQPTMERFRDPHLGRLIQPRHYSSIGTTAHGGFAWAADNDAFNGEWDRDAELAYLKMLDRIEGLPGCRFVALPDVVGDARATADRFNQWREVLRVRDLPIALVAQDGIAELGVPWDKIDALFIGGTDAFKLGDGIPPLVAEAKRHGKWVHMGRVNSMKRLRWAREVGCDSVDGSGFSKFPDIWIPHYLPAMRAPGQIALNGT